PAAGRGGIEDAGGVVFDEIWFEQDRLAADGQVEEAQTSAHDLAERPRVVARLQNRNPRLLRLSHPLSRPGRGWRRAAGRQRQEGRRKRTREKLPTIDPHSRRAVDPVSASRVSPTKRLSTRKGRSR